MAAPRRLHYSPAIAEPPATARPAASVILLRRGGRHRDRGLEVLMLRRGSRARFMPGTWVFAGGVVDPEDRTAAERLGLEADQAQRDELAHRICGARELGEEARVEIDHAELRPWSRWITPEVLRVRFDTRFYVALAPPHSSPEPDRAEMEEARWVAPAAALEDGRSGALAISPPTIAHLEMMAEHRDAESVLAAAESRTVEPILPRVIQTEEGFEVVLPGDPRY